MAEIDADAQWLTVNEVAQHYRVSKRTISRWVLSGQIRTKRIGDRGRLVRIHRSVIEEHDTLSAAA